MSKFLNYPLNTVSGIYPVWHYPFIEANYDQYNHYNNSCQYTRTTKEIFNLVYTGRVKEIDSFIKEGKINPNLRNDKDKPLLHHALDYNQFDIAKILINAGASLNSKDVEGRSPKDIISKKNDTIEVKGLKDLAEILGSDQPGSEAIQDSMQQNENYEESEVNVLGYTQEIPFECIIF